MAESAACHELKLAWRTLNAAATRRSRHTAAVAEALDLLVDEMMQYCSEEAVRRFLHGQPSV